MHEREPLPLRAAPAPCPQPCGATLPRVPAARDVQGALRTVALLCGPPSMEEDTAIPALKELGYAAEDIVRY